MWKHEVPVSLAEFARRLEPAGLRVVEIPGGVWRVTARGEVRTVFVRRFGVEELMISPDGRSWRESKGGMAEIILLAMGDDV